MSYVSMTPSDDPTMQPSVEMRLDGDLVEFDSAGEAFDELTDRIMSAQSWMETERAHIRELQENMQNAMSELRDWNAMRDKLEAGL
jgi:hypothetical protein